MKNAGLAYHCVCQRRFRNVQSTATRPSFRVQQRNSRKIKSIDLPSLRIQQTSNKINHQPFSGGKKLSARRSRSAAQSDALR